MKTLLINLPYPRNKFPIFPIGPASVASFLREHGYNEVELLDLNAEHLNEEDTLRALREKKFDVAGISALVDQYEYLKWIAPRIKEIRNVPVILGNGLGSSSYEIVLKRVPEVDICVIGEGEVTFKELLDNKFNNLQNIKGIAYVSGAAVVKTGERPLIEDLDKLAMPSYGLLNMDKYLAGRFSDTGILNVRTKYTKSRMATIISGRGCPYGCKFCGKTIPGSRLRSIPKIIEEIKFLKDKYNINAVRFIDELLVVDKNRMSCLCGELKKLGLLWDCQGRVNTVDLEILRKMKESGCVAVGLGIESGSQKILDNMNKGVRVSQIKNALEAAGKAGLPVKIQLIFGYPGEDLESLEETVRIIKDARYPGRRFLPICPLPGTDLYREALEKNMIGDEEEFLYKIRDSFDNLKPTVNFTKFSTEKIPAIMRYYCDKMIFNYFIYLLKHPVLFIKNALKFKIEFIKLLVKSMLFITKRNPARYVYTV